MTIYPKLIVTNKCNLMMNEFSSSGCRVINTLADNFADDLFSLLRYKGDVKIVVGDLYPIRHSIQQFLKFVEEAQFSLICISSVDFFDSIMQSRFAMVEKSVEPVVNVGNSLASFASILQDGSSLKLVKECPGYLPLYMAVHKSNIPVKQKIFTNM